jgi:transposase InsO family protein
VLFEWVATDLVGPLVKTVRGHQYILVIVDYATWYPEAILLCMAAAKGIAQELFHLFSWVSIPREILTDQGTAFMSRVMKYVYNLLRIKKVRTSMYHPQMDQLVERFNKTLKQMLKVIGRDGGSAAAPLDVLGASRRRQL